MKKYYTSRCDMVSMRSVDVITLSVANKAFDGFSESDLENAWDWDK